MLYASESSLKLVKNRAAWAPLQTYCLSPFGLLEQDTRDWVAQSNRSLFLIILEAEKSKIKVLTWSSGEGQLTDS